VRRRHSPPKAAFVALALVPLSVLTIAACSTTADSAPPVPGGAGICTADRLGQFNGQPATAELGQQIKAASGASTFRWLPKGSIVTMEYNAARVSVLLDERNHVEASRCG
jgi:Spy/CpxP family protein refolding chaperone